MGLFIPNKRATYRRFSYEPRFWNPEKDEQVKRRIRVGRKARRRSPAGLLFFVLLLAIVLYLYFTFG